MTKIKLPLDKPIIVHPEIARCPYCQGNLIIEEITDAWSNDDGFYDIETLRMYCINELNWIKKTQTIPPEIRQQHSYAPYVYWLPVEEKVIKYLQDNFIFCD